jgi:hypothetical protein
MANKQAKFDLIGILGQIDKSLIPGEKSDLEAIAEPLAPSEKSALDAELNNLIKDTARILGGSRKQQYSLHEVKTKKVPYLDLLVKDIRLSLIGASQYVKEGREQVDAFKSSFEVFAGYRSVSDTGWHLYSYLKEAERDEVIEKACDKIKSKYGNKIDAKLLSKLVPSIKETIETIAQFDVVYGLIQGLIM